VFGDIKDEIDKEPILIREIDNKLIVQWDTQFEDILQRLWIDFLNIGISEDEFSWETTGYVFMSNAKWLPKLGQRITFIIHDIEQQEKKYLIMKISKIEKNTIKEFEVFVSIKKQ
jgi:CBS domain containing-hemolysin-like protein